jgi:hypothetical protein
VEDVNVSEFLQHVQGRRSETLQLMEQVVQLRKIKLGEDHPDTLANNLLRPEDFYVGWICAVQTEYVVACELLDEEYPALPASSAHDDPSIRGGNLCFPFLHTRAADA